jgi:hypothetical protein
LHPGIKKKDCSVKGTVPRFQFSFYSFSAP